MMTSIPHNLRRLFLLLILLLLIGIGVAGWVYIRTRTPARSGKFDGARAYQDVLYQMSVGPRTVGSQAHAEAVTWMVNELQDNHWKVEIQRTETDGVPIQNVIAMSGVSDSRSPWIVVAAHYDSRQLADQDPDPKLRTSPVPGANDGASGVAVLMELARTLSPQVKGEIWLVFLDAEDDGTASGSGWILGSEAFVKDLKTRRNGKLPDDAIILDMIGDKDLNIYKEYNSNPDLTDSIWDQAARLGYNQFIPSYKYRMLDDHIPFLEANIPAVDIIDFDYPYWHTTQDTADKVSAASLQAVGDTVLSWLSNR